MADLVEILYPPPEPRRSPMGLLRWWESRRFLYNKIVGVTGLFTLAGSAVLAPERSNFLQPELLIVVAVYAGLANLFFSLGWATEMVARWIWGKQAPQMGPLLFRQGLIFSVGLTLLPLIMFILISVVRVLVALLGLG